jgi:hypothetical protein
LLFLCVAVSNGYAFQQQITSVGFIIKPVFKGQELKIYEQYISEKKDTLSIEELRFYITDVKITYTDDTALQEDQKAWLLDINNPETLSLKVVSYENKKIKQVSFNVGVDSLSNVSGALGGALDPANGMYWAWQSGYINMKIEGTSSSCTTRKNKFRFHIGGYLPKENALRVVTVPVNKTIEDDITVIMDVSAFFNEISLKENNSIMIPGEKAMLMADYISKMFTLQ